MKSVLNYYPTAIVVAVILYATWFPDPIDPDKIPLIPHIDKLIHSIMMGGLLGALLFDYKRADRKRVLSRSVVLKFMFAVMAFGVFDEIVQGFLPIGRPSDFVDILADWFGAFVAVLTAPPAVNAVLRRKSDKL